MKENILERNARLGVDEKVAAFRVMFEWIEEYMDAVGCDWDTAARQYDYQHNPDYNPEDYDC